MIYEVKEYWVYNGLPSLLDLMDARDIAKKNNCKVILNWKGPGWQWYGDTYRVEIEADSDVEEIIENLNNTVYGL
jgi:hypothetical protein